MKEFKCMQIQFLIVFDRSDRNKLFHQKNPHAGVTTRDQWRHDFFGVSGKEEEIAVLDYILETNFLHGFFLLRFQLVVYWKCFWCRRVRPLYVFLPFW